MPAAAAVSRLDPGISGNGSQLGHILARICSRLTTVLRWRKGATAAAAGGAGCALWTHLLYSKAVRHTCPPAVVSSL